MEITPGLMRSYMARLCCRHAVLEFAEMLLYIRFIFFVALFLFLKKTTSSGNKKE